MLTGYALVWIIIKNMLSLSQNLSQFSEQLCVTNDITQSEKHLHLNGSNRNVLKVISLVHHVLKVLGWKLKKSVLCI